MNKKANIESYIKKFSKDFDKKLIRLIPKNNFFSNKLYNAIVYVVSVGGKRLRPMFVTEISKILGVSKSKSFRAAAAIEFIHCYSLVHDDLPAMDDDDLRRGRQTCHKKFDEATAILVGDALQTLAFQILSDKKTELKSDIRITLVNELSKSSGLNGMVAGQMLDLVAENKKLSLDQIILLQSLKTGQLFRFSCIAGPILARSKYIDKFEKFSDYLGLAFQIKDDLLDVEGDVKQIGKKTRKDILRGKETFISLLGKENAKDKSIELISKAKKILDIFGKKSQRLNEITDYIISRDR